MKGKKPLALGIIVGIILGVALHFIGESLPTSESLFIPEILELVAATIIAVLPSFVSGLIVKGVKRGALAGYISFFIAGALFVISGYLTPAPNIISECLTPHLVSLPNQCPPMPFVPSSLFNPVLFFVTDLYFSLIGALFGALGGFITRKRR